MKLNITDRLQEAFNSDAGSVDNQLPGSDFVCVLAEGDNDSIELTLRGGVGDEFAGNTHDAVAEALAANPEAPVTIKINSVGGSVFEGFGIANALLAHKGEVTAVIEGIAYSAATFPLLVADKVVAHKASTVCIHRALIPVMGNQVEHAAAIKQLDAIDSILIELYAEKTGMSEDEIVELLDASIDGTMLSAKKAVELGFADEIYSAKSDDEDSDVKAKAELDLKCQAHKASMRKRAGVAARLRLREIGQRLAK